MRKRQHHAPTPTENRILAHNLKDFEIAFESAVPATGQRFNSHAVIGENGSGKSNLLEAVVTIFRDRDLNEPASLDYELDYEVRGHGIEVRGERGKTPKVSIDGEATSARKLADHGREYPRWRNGAFCSETFLV